MMDSHTRSVKRRSSILKKSPHRKSMAEVDQNIVPDIVEDDTRRGLKRRVSFANTYQVKEISRVADIAEKWPDSSLYVDTANLDIPKLTSKKNSAELGLEGLNALLSAPILQNSALTATDLALLDETCSMSAMHVSDSTSILNSPLTKSAHQEPAEKASFFVGDVSNNLHHTSLQEREAKDELHDTGAKCILDDIPATTPPFLKKYFPSLSKICDNPHSIANVLERSSVPAVNFSGKEDQLPTTYDTREEHRFQTVSSKCILDDIPAVAPTFLKKYFPDPHFTSTPAPSVGTETTTSTVRLQNIPAIESVCNDTLAKPLSSPDSKVSAVLGKNEETYISNEEMEETKRNSEESSKQMPSASKETLSFHGMDTMDFTCTSIVPQSASSFDINRIKHIDRVSPKYTKSLNISTDHNMELTCTNMYKSHKTNDVPATAPELDPINLPNAASLFHSSTNVVETSRSIISCKSELNHTPTTVPNEQISVCAPGRVSLKTDPVQHDVFGKLTSSHPLGKKHYHDSGPNDDEPTPKRQRSPCSNYIGGKVDTEAYPQLPEDDMEITCAVKQSLKAPFRETDSRSKQCRLVDDMDMTCAVKTLIIETETQPKPCLSEDDMEITCAVKQSLKAPIQETDTRPQQCRLVDDMDMTCVVKTEMGETDTQSKPCLLEDDMEITCAVKQSLKTPIQETDTRPKQYRLVDDMDMTCVVKTKMGETDTQSKPRLPEDDMEITCAVKQSLKAPIQEADTRPQQCRLVDDMDMTCAVKTEMGETDTQSKPRLSEDDMEITCAVKQSLKAPTGETDRKPKQTLPDIDKTCAVEAQIPVDDMDMTCAMKTQMGESDSLSQPCLLVNDMEITCAVKQSLKAPIGEANAGLQKCLPVDDMLDSGDVVQAKNVDNKTHYAFNEYSYNYPCSFPKPSSSAVKHNELKEQEQTPMHTEIIVTNSDKIKNDASEAVQLSHTTSLQKSEHFLESDSSNVVVTAFKQETDSKPDDGGIKDVDNNPQSQDVTNDERKSCAQLLKVEGNLSLRSKIPSDSLDPLLASVADSLLFEKEDMSASIGMEEFLCNYINVRIGKNRKVSSRQSLVLPVQKPDKMDNLGDLVRSVFTKARNLPIYQSYIANVQKTLSRMETEITRMEKEIQASNPEIIKRIRFGGEEESEELIQKVEQLASNCKKDAETSWKVSKSKLYKALSRSMEAAMQNDLVPIHKKLQAFGDITSLKEEALSQLEQASNTVNAELERLRTFGEPPTDDQAQQYSKLKMKITQLSKEIEEVTEKRQQKEKAKMEYNVMMTQLWNIVDRLNENEAKKNEKEKCRIEKKIEAKRRNRYLQWVLLEDGIDRKKFSFLYRTVLFTIDCSANDVKERCHIETQVPDASKREISLYRFLHDLLLQQVSTQQLDADYNSDHGLFKALNSVSRAAANAKLLKKEIEDIYLDYAHCSLSIQDCDVRVQFYNHKPNLCSFRVEFSFSSEVNGEKRGSFEPLSYRIIERDASFGRFSANYVMTALNERFRSRSKRLSHLVSSVLDLIKSPQ